MDNPRAEKVALVDEVRERLTASNAAILTEYRGLNVSDLATLRRSLREAGGQYKIYKNNLVRFAVRDLGLDSFEAMVEGPTAIAFVDGDAASVAKALRDFARTNPHLVVKGGLLGENVLSAADATALAELPSRDVMLAQIAGALAAPLQQLAGLLQALPQNLAYGLRALLDEKGGPPEGGSPEGAEETSPSADATSDESGASPGDVPSSPSAGAEAKTTADSAASEAPEGAPEATAQEEPAATSSPPTSESGEENAQGETPESAG